MNAAHGFRATGIYPFNEKVMTDEAFAPSEVTAWMEASVNGNSPLQDLEAATHEEP